MSTKPTNHCPEDVTRRNVAFDQTLRRRLPHMDLRKWKTIKIVVQNVAILGFALFAIVEGADPTLIGSLTLAIVAVLNGMEASELVDAMRAIQAGPPERRENDQDQNDGPG